MLDAQLQSQLQAYLAYVKQPFELVATLDDSASAHELRELLHTIARLSDGKITVRTDGTAARRPSFAIRRGDGTPQLTFAAVPLGHEFTSLVLALLWAGGHPPKEAPEVLQQARELPGEHDFEVYMSLSCHNCPDVVQALSLLAIVNPRVRTTIIDGALFADEVRERNVMAVPLVLRNGEVFHSGRATLAELLAKLDQGAQQRQAAALAAKEPFDVLVVGGGPAGAAAAVYAARKGIRVGLLAERVGGQVNDTLAIENYPGMLETTGPQLAAALQAHVQRYEVDVMTGARAQALHPAAQPGGWIGVTVEGGATLRARSVVLATGARWRNLNVPGEAEYKNRGVAYCPHCDGPLFKGKRVAVIGGGNSGVEAAIDLAGIVQHVTLLEYAEQLKADAVLVSKLKSLPNVTVLTQAQTLEVLGDGHKVTGLRWRDRASGAEQTLALEGVFVQIGLVPNTEWLGDVVPRNRFGEIEIDAACRTGVPGVLAAGDCTTVPYKQIVVAAGEGAKAALAAFDELIRMPALQPTEAAVA
ncbi:alkyl hydroperoxide reductase subunit F [Tepidimonas aquatica]|uniref:Alkyl hydroperoxide reductase subunit F n=1 Tax=Tepidimonas aquatica TaxID=247482 RepID=A0A554WVP4_9BURK|nr:alkyl hydroperoxide reductase subunit F [Tepidimonas aquatica]TSE27642.1 Alkyl hydroperoxide reductase subunit F [Tepidimonas aquatica]